LRDGQSELARQQEITCVTCTHSDCVAFGAESVDGLEEENLIIGHDTFLIEIDEKEGM
jgi:hypothetical protein